MKKKPAKKAARKKLPARKNSKFLNKQTLNLLTQEPDTQDTLQLTEENTQLPQTTETTKATTKTTNKKKRDTSFVSKTQANPSRFSPLQPVAARKKAFIQAMIENLGVVSKAVQSSKIPMRTHYHWMEVDEQYRDAIGQVKETTLDFYEDALHSLIKKLHPSAIIFALKTQGKKRGYIETVHNVNQAVDDSNVTFYIPDNNRDENIQDANVIP